MAKAKTAREEVVLEGMAEIVQSAIVSKKIADAQKYQQTQMVPTALSVFMDSAKKSDEFDQTFTAVEGTVRATVQLKRKAATSPLSDIEIADLARHAIPMTMTGERIIVNPSYMKDSGANTLLLSRLRELIKANPQSGIPDDFIMDTKPYSVPAENAVVRVLRLDLQEALRLLPSVATVSINGEDITDERQKQDLLERSAEFIKNPNLMPLKPKEPPKLGDQRTDRVLTARKRKVA